MMSNRPWPLKLVIELNTTWKWLSVVGQAKVTQDIDPCHSETHEHGIQTHSQGDNKYLYCDIEFYLGTVIQLVNLLVV